MVAGTNTGWWRRTKHLLISFLTVFFSEATIVFFSLYQNFLISKYFPQTAMETTPLRSCVKLLLVWRKPRLRCLSPSTPAGQWTWCSVRYTTLHAPSWRATSAACAGRTPTTPPGPVTPFWRHFRLPSRAPMRFSLCRTRLCAIIVPTAATAATNIFACFLHVHHTNTFVAPTTRYVVQQEGEGLDMLTDQSSRWQLKRQREKERERERAY